MFQGLDNQITVIGTEMCVQTSRFANMCAQIKQIRVIFTHLKLWVEVAIDNFQVGENLHKLT